jgi:hypothetical protein
MQGAPPKTRPAVFLGGGANLTGSRQELSVGILFAFPLKITRRIKKAGVKKMANALQSRLVQSSAMPIWALAAKCLAQALAVPLILARIPSAMRKKCLGFAN